MIHVLWLVNEFIVTMLCHVMFCCFQVKDNVVSKLRIMTLFLWWKQYAQITFAPESGNESE